MAFQKKVWKDRLSEYATRRILTDQDTVTVSVVEVSRSEGTIYQAGDAFSAENMNDLEDRIEAGIGSGGGAAASLIGPTEELEGTASQAYTVGSYFVGDDNYFYKVTVAISQGDNFVVSPAAGSNCEQTTISTELASINQNLTHCPIWNPTDDWWYVNGEKYKYAGINWDGILFYNGNTYDEKTGGYEATDFAHNGFTKQAAPALTIGNTMSIRTTISGINGSVWTKEKIDFSKVKKIHFKGSSNLVSGGTSDRHITFGLNPTKEDQYSLSLSTYALNGKKFNIELDVTNVTNEQYLFIDVNPVYYNTTVVIEKIWCEFI